MKKEKTVKQKNMKVFSLHLNFLLSDDFQGDLNDAIVQFLAYRVIAKKDKRTLKHWTPDKGDFKEFLFMKFLEALKEGRRAYGEGSLNEYDYKNLKWIPIKPKKKLLKEKVKKEKK